MKREHLEGLLQLKKLKFLMPLLLDLMLETLARIFRQLEIKGIHRGKEEIK